MILSIASFSLFAQTAHTIRTGRPGVSRQEQEVPRTARQGEPRQAVLSLSLDAGGPSAVVCRRPIQGQDRGGATRRFHLRDGLCRR